MKQRLHQGWVCQDEKVYAKHPNNKLKQGDPCPICAGGQVRRRKYIHRDGSACWLVTDMWIVFQDSPTAEKTQIGQRCQYCNRYTDASQESPRGFVGWLWRMRIRSRLQFTSGMFAMGLMALALWGLLGDLLLLTYISELGTGHRIILGASFLLSAAIAILTWDYMRWEGHREGRALKD